MFFKKAFTESNTITASFLKLSIAFSLFRYRNRQCSYSALLDSNSPRLSTVFKYAIMHLLRVSCREAVVHDMQFKQWFLFSWHFTVNCMAKGQFWSCLTSQTDNNLPFFLLTSSMWHSSLWGYFSSGQKIHELLSSIAALPVWVTRCVVCPACTCERSVLAMNHPQQEGRQWNLLIGYSELGKFEQTCVKSEIWYNTWS